MFASLIFNISPNHIGGHFVPYTLDKVAVTPQFPRPKLSSQPSKLLEHLSRRDTLQYLYYFRRREFRWHLQKHMHVVFHYLHRVHPEPIFIRYSLKHFFGVFSNLTYQDFLSILRYPHQVVLYIENSVLCPSKPHASVIQEKTISRQTPLPRLTARPFPSPHQPGGVYPGGFCVRTTL